MKSIKLVLVISMLLILAGVVSATDCWQYDNDQTTCESQNDCQWHEDPWGGWCEQKGCWNFFSQSECTQSNNANSTYFINKSCSWRSGNQNGWCMQVECWAYDGTDQNTCENNVMGLDCEWVNTYNPSDYDYPCSGPPEKDCWTYTNQTVCESITGCTWGECENKDCWDYSDANKATCESQTGFNGKECKWETYSWGTECMEQGCWSYSNITACQANDCYWDGNCMEYYCGTFSSENESYCINNTANLTCSWNADDNWCMESGCWNYDDSTNCNNAANCFWETYEGGWCEEQMCWIWDGDQTTCENTSLHPGLTCVYDNGECYENITSKSCSDIATERDCLDTFYCWWNYSSTQGTCNDPIEGEVETEFQEWNPGCFLFDIDQSVCENTTGCYWDGSGCENNETILSNNELNCTSLNNKTLCNSIPALSTCCKWQAGECVSDRFDQSCKDQMEEPPEGAYYCEDYNAYTDQSLCNQIAGEPWYMPCEWNNNTERCEFKDDDVFAGGEKNIMKIDNKQNCESAGGKWILDTYPSTNNASTAVRLSLGRCDFKFDEERNCNKECYACEYKSDKNNWSSSAKAKEVCINSELGICKFTANANAENGYGYCEPKDEFKKGLTGGDCDADCGACTYYGDPAAESGKRPSDYCENSKAKCRWAPDPLDPDDESKGVCISKSEKICEDKCDKCYSESACKNVGGKQGDEDVAAVCEWDDGICKYKSGADEMEICWDGVDNNGDNKIDCADSMCWSDAFCGGGFMFDDFGKDCFIYDSDQAGCEAEGCAFINETWGSWCDMPGAVCWKKDGTNQTYCEDGGTCEWHSGFGGFCEQDWEMGQSCINYDNNQTECESHSTDENCTWVIDNWCNDVGGWCEGYSSYSGTEYQDCWQYNSQANCDAATDSSNLKTCQWQQDQWCSEQGETPGWCDHKSFACWQYDITDCENATNSVWCLWKTDEYSPEGGWCEGKMMSGESGSCWDQSDETTCDQTSGCSWMSGLCDPPGFGGEMMAGMSGGGGGSGDTGMGGFGMQCFVYDGNQTACENQTGCGWFNEAQPFCDINFESSCPQYSYNETLCNSYERCKWNSQMNFCDEKALECMSNSSLWGNETACNAHPLCYWSDDPTDQHCHPIGYNATTEAECNAYNSTIFKWVTGWCNPAMAAEFFKGMDMGGPPIPLGSDDNDAGIPDEVDIINFGMKDMGDAFGFGITVDDPAYSAACNDVKISSGTGTGTNKTKFYWYLDTDGDTTNNCNLKYDSGSSGYEFYFKNEWKYDSSSGSTTESPAAYRCSEGSWVLAEIKLSSQKQLMCSMVGGAMVGVQKGELEKFPSLYTSGTDIRVSVASADASHNSTDPSDSADPGWVSPGTQDFELLDLYSYESDPTKKAAKEGLNTGFVQYSDIDCWTQAGCSDYSCKDHPYCVENSYGVEAGGFTDTRIPKVIGVIKETYPDSAFFAYFTDKPANGSLLFYENNSGCFSNNLNTSIHDVGVINDKNKEFKLWHIGEIYNDGGVDSLNTELSPGTTYFYKLKVCDNNGKCGMSKCSNFTTATLAECPFCKFVSRIDAPTNWNVYYDLDQDENYEHWQGHILGPKDGMFTNYTDGRRANILLNTTDSHIEFLNVTITKTGMGPKIRDINDNTNALEKGTTTDASGATIGYAGMIEDTRDKIVYNLYPRTCRIKIPGTGTCDALWHCDNNLENCVDRTADATSIETGADYCIWEIPNCEFSTWAGGQPSGGDNGGSSSGGGGGGSSSVKPQCNDLLDNDLDGFVDYPNDPGCVDINDNDESDEGICQEDWTCSNWKPIECPQEEKQTRTCEDWNKCGTENYKPATERTCEYVEKTVVREKPQIVEEAPKITGAAAVEPEGLEVDLITLIGVVGLIAIFGTLVFILLHHKK